MIFQHGPEVPCIWHACSSDLGIGTGYSEVPAETSRKDAVEIQSHIDMDIGGYA